MTADQINKLSSSKVIVIGDFLLDRYIWGKVDRISPEAPIQVLKVQNEDSRLGGAANVAHNLITLGARVIALSVIGPDYAGRKILALLSAVAARWGNPFLNFKGVITDKQHITVIKERMIAHNQQVLRVDKEAENDDYSISRIAERKLLAHFRRYIKDADIIIISDYNKGVLTKSLLSRVISLSHRHNKKILIGPKG
ncbi:MAG: PfkB family carbohydrate kinase, partial [Planctomycetota bacterium]|nr:PfkB family carbohydrate kinase [Planctomycetota bacterium]